MAAVSHADREPLAHATRIPGLGTGGAFHPAKPEGPWRVCRPAHPAVARPARVRDGVRDPDPAVLRMAGKGRDRTGLRRLSAPLLDRGSDHGGRAVRLD